MTLISVGVLGSLSAYYNEDGLIRDLFVGGLFALGILLHRYEGFGEKGGPWYRKWFNENSLLNVAGVAAGLVALIPTDPPDAVREGWFTWHGASAFTAFGCLAIVSWFFHSDTLRHTNEPGTWLSDNG